MLQADGTYTTAYIVLFRVHVLVFSLCKHIQICGLRLSMEVHETGTTRKAMFR